MKTIRPIRHPYESLLNQLRTEYQELESLLAQFDAECLQSIPIHGGWSVRDILAHLTAWDKRGIEWITTALDGDKPHIPAPQTTWSGRHKLNQITYAQAQHQFIGEVLAEYREIFSELLELLEGMESEAWQMEVHYIYNNTPAIVPIPMQTLVRWRLNHLVTHKKSIAESMESRHEP
jgi:hypothetical protein